MKKQPVIFICGATASGKTSLAMNLYREYNSRLINVDAAQVYRHMNIGTAKATDDELKVYPHELINIRNPWEIYSAADFCKDVEPIIEDAVEKQQLPILVGGTMFYFSALENGLSQLPSADENVRREIEGYENKHGEGSLYNWLKQIDLTSYDRLKANDRQRIQRAIELYLLTGKSATECYASSEYNLKGINDKYDIIKIALALPDRKLLHELIYKRFEIMLEQGLIDEVSYLYHHAQINKELSSMKIVGYRQVWEYLDGMTNYQEMVDKSAAATRQLAKRQLTWLRNQSNMVWIPKQNEEKFQSAVLGYLKARIQ